jgi:hypothetical protein
VNKTNLFQISQALSERIAETSFLHKARKVVTSFTRKRKMPFSDMIRFIVSCTNRSLQTELDDYCDAKEMESVSRQAFSKSRENIKHEAFIDLNDLLVLKFEEGEIKKYHGYRLYSVDGTLIDLPNTQKLRERFGYSSNATDIVYAKGLAMTAFDVLNKITVFAELYRYDDSEKRRILDIVDGFAKRRTEQSIWLLDRGYPSFELFNRLTANSQCFVIRVSSNSLKEINNANKPDQVIKVTRNSKTIGLRVVNIALESGLKEKLVTNLSSDFTVNDFKELYIMRWGIETNYRFLKCKTFLEVFTGESITAVLQDFHASILVLNLAAVAELEQDEILKDNNAVCSNGKYNGCVYRPNKTKLIGDIKRDFVKLMSFKCASAHVFLKYRLYRNIKRYAFLVIPDRVFPRQLFKDKSRRKAHLKSSL